VFQSQAQKIDRSKFVNYEAKVLKFLGQKIGCPNNLTFIYCVISFFFHFGYDFMSSYIC